MNNWKQRFEDENAWGICAGIDVHDCDADLIRDADAIKRFTKELVDKIEMKAFGECVVVNFGEDEEVAGFSMTQLIETSLISGHFANKTNRVFLDVFSCKFYEPEVVASFAQDFFKGSSVRLHVSLRY